MPAVDCLGGGIGVGRLLADNASFSFVVADLNQTKKRSKQKQTDTQTRPKVCVILCDFFGRKWRIQFVMFAFF